MFFEVAIEDQLASFAGGLATGARVLDAGAGECQHASFFASQRYVAVDLAVGDPRWDYTCIDVIADLSVLPFQSESFDACINIVTLEHLPEPARALEEMYRVLGPEGKLLMIAPHEWEVHQAPHDYFRYTRHGLEYLLKRAGFRDYTIEPVGGYFRLMSRRLLNGLQFFRGPWMLAAGLCLVPPALIVPLFDGLDKWRDFTLGYVCVARK